MKRTALRRKTSLSRVSPVSKRPAAPPAGPRSSKPPRAVAGRTSRPPEPGEAEWKVRHKGICVACGSRGRVLWHHAVLEQVIRKAGGDPWDPRWAIPICVPYAWGGSHCHDAHHHWGVNDTRLEYAKIPAATIALAREVLGEGPAIEHFRRRYRGAP